MSGEGDEKTKGGILGKYLCKIFLPFITQSPGRLWVLLDL
jgi:hypothetical protein